MHACICMHLYMFTHVCECMCTHVLCPSQAGLVKDRVFGGFKMAKSKLEGQCIWEGGLQAANLDSVPSI